MNVFKPAITLSVILMVLMAASPAHAQWGYKIDPPVAPNLTRTQTLTNPTVAQIQQAIAPNTLVKVIGNVSANGGGVLEVNVNNVRLDFTRANEFVWQGGDTWAGFVNISGQRVEVLGLKMRVQGPGRCRGVMLFTPASDVRISGSSFTAVADGFVADCEFERLVIENTNFLGITNFQNTSMEGGYGIFMEEDDYNDDHVRLSNVKVTLAGGATQHGIRISKVQRMLIENSDIGANEKRSFWAYGVDRLCLRNSVFRDGSLLFGLMGHEKYADRSMSRIRLDGCTILHTGIMQPLGVYCSTGTTNFRMRNLDIRSTSTGDWMQINWRSNDKSEKIRWRQIRFNGQPTKRWDNIRIFGWNENELRQNRIAPFPLPQ